MPDIGANGKVAPCLGLFTLAAFCCSMVASYSCEFLSSTLLMASVGIWQGKIGDGGCIDFDDVFDVSDKVKAARAMAVLTTIFGLILMVAGCAMSCIPFPAKIFKCFSVAYFFVTLFEGLKFVLVIDVENYSLEYGANNCIAATSLWFVCMLMSCAVKPPEDDDSSPKEKESKNEEEEKPKNEEEAKPDEES